MITRRPEAVMFGNYLASVMARRGYTQMALARKLHSSHGRIYNWTAGRCLPDLEHASELAEVLNDARVLAMVVRARTGRCRNPACGRPYEVIRQSRRLYCSNRCQETAHNRNTRRDPRQDAIDEHCRQCEPDGICRTAECPLRAFSPYVFVPLRRSVA